MRESYVPSCLSKSGRLSFFCETTQLFSELTWLWLIDWQTKRQLKNIPKVFVQTMKANGIQNHILDSTDFSYGKKEGIYCK